MADLQTIQFVFYKLTTDEFALTAEKYDPAAIVEMKIGMTFNYIKEEKVIIVQFKCMAYQLEKLLAVVAVSCLFKIVPEDWEKIYNEESKTFVLPRVPALHLASLTVSTARGVFHAKTENNVRNAIVIPPVNVNEMFKEDVVVHVKE